MEFESGFRLGLDQDASGLCSQAMSTQSLASFSSTSSAYRPFTPSSRRSTSHDLGLALDISYGPFSSAYPVYLTSPSTASMSNYVFEPIKAEQDTLSFHHILSTIPMKELEGSLDHENMLEINLASQNSIGSITSSNPSGMYTSSSETTMGPALMMTPTQSLTDLAATNDPSSWACSTDSPNTFPRRSMQPGSELNAGGLDRRTTQSPLGGRYSMHLSPSPNDLRMPRRHIVEEIQRSSVQVRGSRKRTSKQNITVDVALHGMCKCDYLGCHKAFRRNEHLKRHKHTLVHVGFSSSTTGSSHWSCQLIQIPDSTAKALTASLASSAAKTNSIVRTISTSTENYMLGKTAETEE